ncbi:MAG: hypothetical protein RR712_04375 [Terrisporobacter sp.]
MVKIGNSIFLHINEIAEGFNSNVKQIKHFLDDNNVRCINFEEDVYVLESEFLRIFTGETLIPSYNSSKKNNIKYPVTEKEILAEALNVLQRTGKVSIKELREVLKNIMNLSEEDLKINKNRNDTKFDQKVRNLISHRDSNGLTRYCDYEKIGKEGYLKLKER